MTAGKHRGFTLIELIIVLTIMAMLMGLVGPLMISSLEKSQAKVEAMTFSNWLKKVSFKALMRSEPLILVLNGKQARLENEQQQLKLVNFDYLFFQPQTVRFNSKGFPEQTRLVYQLRGDRRELALMDIVNGSQ